MEAQVATEPAEDKHSLNWGAIIATPFLMLLIYILSVGPMVMLADKKLLSPKSMARIENLYAPVELVYRSKAFHRPFGMYLHLWSKRFGSDGEMH